MIDALFSIPVGRYNINREISEKELSYIKELPQRQNKSNKTSVDFYVLNNCKELEGIKNFLEDCLDNYLSLTFAPNKELIQTYITQSWVNYTDVGKYHHLHKHQNSIVSGVFYPQVVEGRDNITFRNFDSTAGTSSPLHIEPVEFNKFNSSSWDYPVSNGELFLFPSPVQHAVAEVKSGFNQYDQKGNDIGSLQRISLSFNTWCNGVAGMEKELNHLVLSKEERYDTN